MTADPVVSYTVKSASEATGLSADIIKRAIRAGDLKATRPRVAGREIAKDVITATNLERWLNGGTR